MKGNSHPSSSHSGERHAARKDTHKPENHITDERHAARQHLHEQEHRVSGKRHAAKKHSHKQEHHMTDDFHDSQEEIEEHDIEGIQEKGWLDFLREPANVRRNILETNIIHYVAQYGRIIGELMRTKRISKDVVAREKAGVKLFRECVLSNVRNAREGSTNCCAIGGLEDLRFQECSSLSRMLYQNLTALRTMEDDKDGKKYNDFVKWNLSDNAMKKLWNFGQSTGKLVFMQVLWMLLLRAFQLDLLGTVVKELGFDLKEQVYIKKLIDAYSHAEGKATENIKGAIKTLLGNKHDQGTTIPEVLEVSAVLGQGFMDKLYAMMKKFPPFFRATDFFSE